MRNTTTSSRQFALATESRTPASLTPSIRLVSATPFAIGDSADANNSASNSFESSWASISPSVIAPKSDAPPRKRLVPKKSKLGLLGPKGKEPLVTSDQKGADNPSTREGFEIFVDPTNDPEFNDVLVVKKQKSRLALNGMNWGALGEVTNVPNVPRDDPTALGSALKSKEEDKKWWSIGGARKDSKNKENVKRSKSPEAVRSKTPEPFKTNQDSRIRFNSLDSGVLLGRSTHKDVPPVKASTASEPELFSHLTHHGQRSFTPDSLREACRSPSPVPSRSTSPPPTLSGFLAPSKEQGSIALRAIRSVKSLARMGSWAPGSTTENGLKNVKVKEKKESGEKKERKERKEKKEKKEKKENRDGTVREKKERKERKERKEKERKSEDGTVRIKKEKKKEKKERTEKKESREEKENIGSLRRSTSSFGAGTVTSLERESGAQTLGKKKLSILGMGLGLPSSMRLRSGSTASSVLPQSHQHSAEPLGNPAKLRLGSTMSTASSLRPYSTASSSGGSSCTRESRGSVKWDEVCLENAKKEIQKEKKEKRQKRKEEGKESKKSKEGRRRVAITDVFPEVAPAPEYDSKDELQKRYSSAFPIATIEEAPTDDLKETGNHRHAESSGKIVSEIEKRQEEDTPIKRHRIRPMSEQLLGKPRPHAVYEDEEGVISILDAATNDLAQLINNLDLEATPASADPTPIRPPPFPAGILDSIPVNFDFNFDLSKKGAAANDSPLKNKSPSETSKGLAPRHNTASISSLRPYAQSRGKATKTQTTPVFVDCPEGTIGKKTSELGVGQPIAPWPVLLQQVSPVKEPKVQRDCDKENAAPKEPLPQVGTWRKGHKRSVTPVPEPEPGFVFQSLRPPKPRAPKSTEAEDGKATLRLSSSSFFAPSSVVSNLANIVKGPASPSASSSIGRRASAFLRKHCSLLPVPADVSGADASFACAGLPSDTSHPEIRPSSGRKRGLPPTLGGSDVSCYAVPQLDASDPDSDIPDELRFELKANSDRESDDDTFDFSRRFTLQDSDEIEYPRSALPIKAPQIPPDFLDTSRLSDSLTDVDVLAEDIEIDEGEHADVESDPEADTKKSFDFTGELRRLNESGGSDRHSFVEQLERAFKTPAKVDLRYGLDNMMSVEVPPVPRLPLDLDMKVKGIPSRVSFDFSKFVDSDGSRELSRSTWRESQPEAFNIYEVSKPVDVREPGHYSLQSKDNKPASDKTSQSPFYANGPERSCVEGKSVDSDNWPNRIIVSADPTEVMNTSSFNLSRPSDGKLDASFKFGGLHSRRSPEFVKEVDEQLTLSDIIPPLSRVRTLSSSSESLEDDSLFKSIFAPADDPVPEARPRPAADDNPFLQVRDSLYRTSQASSVVSFTGFDSFDEVRRGFEFNSQRPGFYPPPAANNRRVNHNLRDSVLSIASVSSYGHVINPGAADPFDFGLPSLAERPSSENLSTMSFSIDDTFSFLKRGGRRNRVDSDASSFYFQSQAPLGYQCNNSSKSISSQAPPISRYHRHLAPVRRSDSGASAASKSTRRKSWRASQRFNNSTDSIISDLASMQLGRPGLGDKMFESDYAMPLTSIAASPTSDTDMFSLSGHQPTYDSIIDEDRRMSMNATDSLFGNSTQQGLASSGDSIFGHDDSHYLQAFPHRQFRPISIMSAATSVHSLPHDDDTMITMLGGGHVRRRSLGSIMEGSPCARAEKRKHAALQQDAPAASHEYESPNKARIIEQPSFGSPFHFRVEGAARSKEVFERPSLENSCLVGNGEESSISSRRLPVFTRPPPASRSRSSTVTSSSGGDSPPLLVSDCSSISGSSMSSIDLSDLDAMLADASLPSSTLSHARARARTRGHGHRRRYSHVRSSRACSVYETIEEELSSAATSPVHSPADDKGNSTTQAQPVFIVDGDMASARSNSDDTVSLWDDERGITALRRYYALQDEAQSTVSESKQTWSDTPFSIFAVQSFEPPPNPEGMKALLEHSIQTFGPLPSELRVRRCRSRKNSRPSPYPHTRPSKATASSESIQFPPPLPQPPVPSLLASTASAIEHTKVTPSSILSALDSKSSALKDANATIRPRVRSTTRRPALGVAKNHPGKPCESTETTKLGDKRSGAGGPTASTEQKENVGMGNIITSGETLRINRPRPKRRPTLASSTMNTLRSVQI